MLKCDFFIYLLASQMTHIKFNGPARSNSVKSLEEDLKMIKVMLKPVNASKAQNGAAHLSRSADLIEQLPNTISVSFKNTIGHELVAALGKMVSRFAWCLSFSVVEVNVVWV